LEEILNLMVMNGVFFSTVNDSLYTWNFPSQLLPLLARHFKTTASSDTDTTFCLWH
jgi:hypothetical protein